jgi:hypothetical protein
MVIRHEIYVEELSFISLMKLDVHGYQYFKTDLQNKIF